MAMLCHPPPPPIPPSPPPPHAVQPHAVQPQDLPSTCVQHARLTYDFHEVHANHSGVDSVLLQLRELVGKCIMVTNENGNGVQFEAAGKGLRMHWVE